MTETNKSCTTETDISPRPFTHPAAQKAMAIMEFILGLCRLVKSIMKKVFNWLEKWKYGKPETDSGKTDLQDQ